VNSSSNLWQKASNVPPLPSRSYLVNHVRVRKQTEALFLVFTELWSTDRNQERQFLCPKEEDL